MLSIGNVQALNPDLIQGVFSRIDIYSTKEIAIAAKKVKILTNHPETSYKLEDTKLGVTNLIITNPDEFWATSKYLVIEVSNDNPNAPVAVRE